MTAPFTWTGNTCGSGATDDCTRSPSRDVQWEVFIPNDGTWAFSVCGATFDTQLNLGTSCCSGDVSFDDDGCGGGELASELVIALSEGTYFLTLESAALEDCGQFQLIVEPGVD